jgi:hypothetical protein
MKNSLGLLVLLITGCGDGGSGTDDMGAAVCPTALIDGICFANPPPAAAQRTACGDVTEFCDKAAVKAPNLTCLTTPPTPKAGPATVTVTGFIDVFSNGPDSRGISITVYDASQLIGGQDIATASPIAMLPNVMLDPATQRACDTDAKEGCSIPSSTGCTVPVCGDGLNGHSEDNKYCKNDGAMGSCQQRLRWEARYTLPNIPTNKHLAIRTTGPNGMSNQQWATLVSWNVYIPADERACTDKADYDCYDKTNPAAPVYQFNVNALSRTDYVNIPTTAGLSGGISDGQGAVAGEIHDCDNIRVENVSVGVFDFTNASAPKPAYDRFAYFNGNPLKTLPDSSRTATDRLGLFTGLNTKPGKVRVVSAGLVGSTMTPFGTFDVIVYPNTVSVVNINGGKPKP